MTARERRGELVPLSLYIQEMSRLVVTTKSAFLNMPARLSSRVEGLSKLESNALMEASMKEILRSLASGADSMEQKISPGARVASDTSIGIRKRRPKRSSQS